MTTASIVIPVFNRAHLVHRAIDSALAQTHPCEVLVVDHGSTDAITDVVSRYDRRVRYIRRDFDTGPIAAWRDGVEQSQGEFVHITYDDDWIQPTFMERCVQEFDKHIAFVYSSVHLHVPGRRKPLTIEAHPAGERDVGPLVQHLLRRPYSLSPGCAVFRRSDILLNLLPEVPGAAGRFGPKSGVGEDLLLFLLTTIDYPAYVHVPDPLADFLAHDGSITIRAQQQGRALELSNAYRAAKDYYLSREGALPEDPGLARLLSSSAWALTPRTFRSHLAVLAQRFR